jgi:hypothetical protein
MGSPDLIAKAIKDGLSHQLSRALGASILDCALRRSGSDSIPQEMDDARRFISQQIGPCVQERFDADTAHRIEARLLELLLTIEGSSRSGRTTVAPPAASRRARKEAERPPLVLVASMDRMGVRRIARFLGGAAEVRAVKDVFEMATHLEEAPRRRVRVVVDCCAGRVDPTTLAETVPNLPRGRAVILWGVDDARRKRVEAKTAAASEWLACSEAATHEEVADLIRSAL